MVCANNAMEILKLLPRTNCKACQEPTCLVFAVNVFNGKKEIKSCPYLTEEVTESFCSESKKSDQAADELLASVLALKQKVAAINFEDAARRTGASFTGDSLIVRIFGKDVRIDKDANMSSDIHLHPWLVIPVLNYLLNCAGAELTGKWVSMRDIKDGMAWNGLFEQRCEKPLRRIIDNHPDLFDFMSKIFNARENNDDSDADVSIILPLLAKFPIIIRYWKPEDGMESKLNIFFDSSAKDNLDLDSIYALGAGLVRMFEKIADTHAS